MSYIIEYTFIILAAKNCKFLDLSRKFFRKSMTKTVIFVVVCAKFDALDLPK